MVTVKGKTRPAEIFEVFASDGEPIMRAKLKSKPVLEAGIEKYRNGEFPGALAHFDECAEICPDDVVAHMYRERCRKCMENPPQGEWLGVETLHLK